MKSNLIIKLNQNIADLHILYVKLHNYHWNVKGMQFMPIHNMTEEFYNYVAELYDAVAERVLQLGDKPFSSVKEYLEHAQIKEESANDFSAEQVLAGVIADFEYLLSAYKELLSIAEEQQDVSTANIVSDTIQWLEKSLWMLKASSKK